MLEPTINQPTELWCSLPGRPIHAFVLDSNAINRVDSVAIKELSALIHEWRAAKVEIFFAGLKGKHLRPA